MSLSARRAWIEIIEEVSKYVVKESLSARRAWIEIVLIIDEAGMVWSLSARRAWIEIHTPHSGGPWQAVALRKESVDRNREEPATVQRLMRRSPQGERG